MHFFVTLNSKIRVGPPSKPPLGDNMKFFFMAFKASRLVWGRLPKEVRVRVLPIPAQGSVPCITCCVPSNLSLHPYKLCERSERRLHIFVVKIQIFKSRFEIEYVSNLNILARKLKSQFEKIKSYGS